jgi:hypothetical protein
MPCPLRSFPVALALTLLALPAVAKTYPVGPTRTDKTINAVAGKLVPGDIVEVDGDATYTGGIVLSSAGAKGNPITVRGLRVNGKFPVLTGGTNTIEIRADHYVLEGFDITLGAARCVYHHADDVLMRELVVHDCPKQGLLGADQDSGSLTLEYSRFYGSGSGDTNHQIYMATDEVAHPGSVFRMQHCYVHDGVGGNNVKSRAERNEIYYNWIEGAFYQELELIGPDPNGAQSTWTEALAREDSDVVGNVLRQTGTASVVRFGGDGTGQSNGRYRFVNNTVLTEPGGGAVFRLFTGLESVEMHNNVFMVQGGTGLNLLREVEAQWTGGRVVGGSHNWVLTGASNVPPEWTGTVMGSNPGFTAALNPRPLDTSPLHDAGATTLASPAGHVFSSPLAVPAFDPPMHALEVPGTALPRVLTGLIDIGAFESTAAAPPDGGVCGCGGAAASSGGAPGAAGGSAGGAGALGSGGRSAAAGASASSGGKSAAGGSGAPTGNPRGGASGQSSGTGGGAGGAGGAGGSAAFDGGVASQPSGSRDDPGCGCRVTAVKEHRTGMMAALFGLGMAVRRRRSRAAPSRSLAGRERAR